MTNFKKLSINNANKVYFDFMSMNTKEDLMRKSSCKNDTKKNL